MNSYERLTKWIESADDGFEIEYNVLKADIQNILDDAKIQEQYEKQLEADNEKLRRIVNILCDTITQLL